MPWLLVVVLVCKPTNLTARPCVSMCLRKCGCMSARVRAYMYDSIALQTTCEALTLHARDAPLEVLRLQAPRMAVQQVHVAALRQRMQRPREVRRRGLVRLHGKQCKLPECKGGAAQAARMQRRLRATQAARMHFARYEYWLRSCLACAICV